MCRIVVVVLRVGAALLPRNVWTHLSVCCHYNRARSNVKELIRSLASEATVVATYTVQPQHYKQVTEESRRSARAVRVMSSYQCLSLPPPCCRRADCWRMIFVIMSYELAAYLSAQVLNRVFVVLICKRSTVPNRVRGMVHSNTLSRLSDWHQL